MGTKIPSEQSAILAIGTVSGEHLRITVAFSAIYVIWGSTYVAIRVMVETIPPLFGAGIRFLTAGALLAITIYLRNGRDAFRWNSKQLRGVATTALLLVVGGPGLTTIAEKDVPSSLAALIVSSVPLWIVLWRLILGEKVGKIVLLATSFGFLGVAILLWSSRNERLGSLRILGVLLLIVVALSYSTGSLITGRISMPSNVFAVSAGQMLVAGVVLTASSLMLEGKPGIMNFSTSSLVALLYLIGPGSLVAFTAYVWLLRRVPISKVSTYAYVNPVVAVGLGRLLLGETITISMLSSAAITVTAVAIVITSGPRRQSKPLLGNALTSARSLLDCNRNAATD